MTQTQRRMTIKEAVEKANREDPDFGYTALIYVCDECDIAHETSGTCAACGTRIEGVLASALAMRGY